MSETALGQSKRIRNGRPGATPQRRSRNFENYGVLTGRRFLARSVRAAGASEHYLARLKTGPAAPGWQLRWVPRNGAGVASPLSTVPLTFVDSFAELERFWRWLGQSRSLLAIDTETTGLSLSQDRIRLVQFGDRDQGWAIPWGSYKGVVQEALSRYRGPIVGHHIKFDIGFLQKAGVRFDWSRVHDTLPMAFLVNSMGPKSLKGAAGLYVDQAARAGQQELRNLMARNGWTWGTVPVTHPVYHGYAAGDTVLTARLADELWPRVQPYRAAYELELATARVLCGMELRGVRIDVAYCENQLDVLQDQLEKLLVDLEPLNPNAPHQVVAGLESLGAYLTKRTGSGQLAVDDEVLSALVESFPNLDDPIRLLASRVSEARDVQKLISAFFGNFLRYRDGDILHPHYNQLAARTGRMSVSEPALQQVPKQALVRDAFIPREGNRLIIADYDNEELRVAAHFCQDRAMLKAFADGRDLHLETAQRVFGIDTPTSKQRGIGKKGMFSKAYGAGVPKFARTVGLSESDAARVFNTINELYPGMNDGMMRVTRIVRERAAAENEKTGYVTLADGRRLRVPADGAYKGFNFLIQGSCASVMKQALVDLDRVGLGAYLNLSVHDEVMLDVPEADVPDAVRTVQDTMYRDDFSVPLTTSAVVLNRWGSKYREDG